MKRIDSVISWLDGEAFKKACYIGIAFAAGYFTATIIRGLIMRGLI